ncbi:type II secretion system protein, partial [Escherichia coli]|uniref:type II secretion system protein n=1 Tax=Escherichia coli TaxID=562 RepID=UPI003985F9B2
MIKRGFSLIELLVVISIISVLLAILIPSLSKAKQTSKNLKCQVSLRSLAQGHAMYMNTYNSYIISSTDYTLMSGYD